MSKELLISSSPHETRVAVLEDDQLVEVYYQRDTDVGMVGGIYKGRVRRVLPGMQSAFVDIGLERDAFLYVSDFFEDSEEYDRVLTEAEARVARYTEEPGPGAATHGTPLHHLVQGTPPQATQSETSASEPAAETPSGEAMDPRLAAGAADSTAPEAGLDHGSMTLPPGPAEATAPPPSAGLQPSPPGPGGEVPVYRRQEHRGRRRRRRGRGFGESRFGSRPEFRDRPTERPEGRTTPAFEILPGESLAKYSHGSSEAPSKAEAAEPPPLAAQDQDKTSATCSTESSYPVEAHFQSQPDSPLHGETTATTRDQPAAAVVERLEHSEVAAPAATPVESAEHAAELHNNSPAAIAAQPAEPASLFRAVADQGVAAGNTTQGQSARPEHIGSGAPAASDLRGESAPAEAATVEPAAPDAAAEAADRTYTLREPHQRPRFAPRRGRRGGRFGHRSPRTEAGPSYRSEPSRSGNDQGAPINELLKEGQEILVQIAKEPLGTKGARITSHIALPGRYLVYMPTIEHIGVSRKIASEEERLRLRNIILENKGLLTGGFIVRTAGAGRSGEEFKADLKFLSTLWGEIRAKAERAKAPALLHRDLTLVQRILRDILSPDFKMVRVDNEIEYEHTLEFVSRCQPALVGHVKLYTRDTPLFEELGVQAEIDKALKPKVWLRSGGYIVINQTEALVAIDVNTGKFVGKTNRLEDTIVKVNIDAIKEIVRQIRLRDLGGIIVIDFIDMDDRRNRIKVVQALEEALRFDRAPNKILSFNEFGLVALTRKRVKQSLERTLCERCSYCTGSGWIKSVTTVCYEILAEVRKMSAQIEGDVITLRVNPEVARALKSREGVLISELESITHKDVVIKSDPAVHQERFEIF